MSTKYSRLIDILIFIYRDIDDGSLQNQETRYEILIEYLKTVRGITVWVLVSQQKNKNKHKSILKKHF